MLEKPFNIDGLAARWEVTPGTIYRMIQRGDLRAFRAGKAPLRISAAEVIRHEAGECGGLNTTGPAGAPSDGTKGQPSELAFVPRIVGRPREN